MTARMMLIGWLLLLAGQPVSAAEFGDAGRGVAFLQSQRCFRCHLLDSRWKGSAFGPILGSSRTPSTLVGAIWSHLPAMWSGAAQADGSTPVTVQNGRDMLAYFAAAGYFEQSGAVAEGAKVYTAFGCATCHGAGGRHPLSSWEPLSHPISLLAGMWRHGPAMWQAMRDTKMSWKSLSRKQMGDLVAYLLEQRPNPGARAELRLGDPDAGRRLVERDRCASCHGPARLLLDSAAPAHTLTGVAAMLWNHNPLMLEMPPALSQTEIEDLLGFLWSRNYFDTEGRGAAGGEVFRLKRCGLCHSTVPGGAWDAASMLAAAWKHSPATVARLLEGGTPWPQFLKGEMADLIAFLNRGSEPSR